MAASRRNPVLLVLGFFGLLIASAVLGVMFDRQPAAPTAVDAVAGEAGNSCRACHGAQAAVPGDPHAEIACQGCHLGDPTAAEAEPAHAGMVRLPGNLADATRTCGACHAEAVANVSQSLMTTNLGLVSVDRFVFGEQPLPDGLTPITAIGHSPADDHLRNLCATCHLGATKADFGPVDDASRGGGCNACHLNYDTAALAALSAYRADPRAVPEAHPTLDLAISDEHCLGCHSRSGRIAMNYAGWHETDLAALPPADAGAHRQLRDGRVFRFVADDVHHAAGLGCVDCHTSADVMGDGQFHFHEEAAVKIRCEDCHRPDPAAGARAIADLPEAYARIRRARGYTHETILATARDGVPLVNTYLPGDGRAYLYGKSGRALHELRAPSAACTREFGHRDLSCAACHSAWAPQCVECHTRYEADEPGWDLLADAERTGAWMETAGPFRAEAPPLGVYEHTGEPGIRPAVPGMILHLDQGAFPDLPEDLEPRQFHRLFAPASPHTTAAVGRDCRSCHNNPVALGYGRGTLTFVVADGRARWTFSPEAPADAPDGRPPDAWIGFLEERTDAASTRSEFRPFSRAEQERILTVGACFECHDPASERMRATLLSDFADQLERLPEDCARPFHD